MILPRSSRAVLLRLLVVPGGPVAALVSANKQGRLCLLACLSERHLIRFHTRSSGKSCRFVCVLGFLRVSVRADPVWWSEGESLSLRRDLTMTPPVSAVAPLWPLQNCIREVQQLNRPRTSTKAKATLYSATMGLLVHAKRDRALLFT